MNLNIKLPPAPTPLGAYVETVQTGNLLFLSGTLPVEAGVPKFPGRIGGELSLEEGRAATRLAALNALALAREHLGSLDRVSRVVRLGVNMVTTPEFRDHPKVAEVREQMEATGKITSSESTIGKDGKSRKPPAPKSRPSAPAPKPRRRR